MEKKDKEDILRHSLSHILAAAVKRIRPGVKLAIGPSVENGFYYDFDLGEEKISESDLPRIEKEMKRIIKEGRKFEAYEMSIAEALEKEKKSGQAYKAELIEDLKKAGEKKARYYKLGDFEDLCRGPHIESAGLVEKGSFKLTKIAGAYWRGSEDNKMLTRIYGAAFSTAEKLNDHLRLMAEAEARNHRKIGAEMELFKNFPKIGQGLPVWLPSGYTMRRILEDYMWKMERSYGYVHILTPVINKKELFLTSGHLGFYDKDMYSPMEIDKEIFYLKPMNCPAGMMVYKMKPKSYRDLPYKQGEFGLVHRYERSGELHGLQRVRGFTQNDAHIFCTNEQLKGQFLEVFAMLERFYKDVGFNDYRYRLSLSDSDSSKYVGKREDWLRAEDAMREVLTENKVDFYEVEGEAAFYGPKLDVQAINVFGKEDSIATIQVDFNLPQRFDITYVDRDGKTKRPFVIHRALIGSFERFFAFLIEFYAGKFPLWMAPVQVKILAVSEKHEEYCRNLAREFITEDIRAEIDISGETVGKKILNTVKERVPYVLVIGDKEKNSENLAVRERDKKEIVEWKKSEFIKEIKKKVKEKK